VSDGDMSSLAALTGTSNANAFTVTITDASVNAAALNAVNVTTSVDVNALQVTTLTGSARDISDAYTASNATTITGLGNETVTITGDTAATIAQLKNINTETTGVITLNSATNAATYSDTIVNLLAAFAGTTYTLVILQFQVLLQQLRRLIH